MLIHQLPYHHDSAQLFERVAAQPWAMFLDSGQMLDAATNKPGSQHGRYDIIVAEPFITLVTAGEQTQVCQNGELSLSSEDPFLILKNLLDKYPTSASNLPFAGRGLPFAGGGLGYFGYDLGRRLEILSNTATNDTEVPDMMIGIYDWAVVVDHREKTTQLVSHAMHAQTPDNWPELIRLFANSDDNQNTSQNANQNAKSCHESIVNAPLGDTTNKAFAVSSAIEYNLPQPQYNSAFAKIKAYISAGDCYQVNLAQRFKVTVRGNSWQMYQQLRTLSPAPFMAYMNLPFNENEQFQVLSNSPERFLQTDGHHVETRPIKGTRPRSADAAEDLAYSNELLTSAKDKAENVMIVDLLRNDLSKNCQIGSVKTTALFQLQSFANVHHMVSIIVGKLAAGKTAVDVLRGSFPGGSITGAPKLRAMQIIEELEPNRRGLYCGAIGYIGFDGKMDTNIAIRTAVINKNHLIFYAGGGIVADSDVAKEYAETLDKASSFTTIIKLFTRH